MSSQAYDPSFASPGATLFNKTIAPPEVTIAPAPGQAVSLSPGGSLPGSVAVTPSSHGLVATSESTTSTAYTDLATVGPTLSNLPDGIYLFFFGASLSATDSSRNQYVNLAVNGVAAADDIDAANTSGGGGQTPMSFTIKTLTNNGNSAVKLVYRSTGSAGVSTFANRRLLALRIGNITS